MIFLPDTNACISLLRRRTPRLMARWQSTPAADIVHCSVVVYELRYGAERSSNPAREHAKLDIFLEPSSLCHSTMPARIDVRRFALSWKEMVH